MRVEDLLPKPKLVLEVMPEEGSEQDDEDDEGGG